MLSKLKSIDSKIWFFIFSSIIFTLFLSFTSPLMIKYSNVDDNAFLSVGRILKQGGVLYKDVFEQKGPLFLFLFYLQELVSEKFYILLFIINVLLNIAVLFYSFEYSYSVTKSKAKSYFVSILAISFYYILAYSMLIPETFVYAIFLYLIYVLNNNVNNSNVLFSNKQYFINGIIISFIIFSKFLMIFSIIALYLSLMFILVKNRRYKELFNSIIFTTFGFIILTMPVIIYFWLNHYLVGFVHDYIFVNYKYYGVTNMDSILSKDFNRNLTMPWSLFQNIFKSLTQWIDLGYDVKITILKLIMIFSVVYIIIMKKIFNNSFYILVVSLLFGYVYGEYFGKFVALYYLLPGFAFTVIMFSQILLKINMKYFSKTAFVLIPIIFIICVQPKIWLNSNLFRDTRSTEVESQATYISSKIQNPKILQLTLDEGIYQKLNVKPLSKFFYVPNEFDQYELLWDKNLNIVKSKQPDFIVADLGTLSYNSDRQIRIKKLVKYLKKYYKRSEIATKMPDVKRSIPDLWQRK